LIFGLGPVGQYKKGETPFFLVSLFRVRYSPTMSTTETQIQVVKPHDSQIKAGIMEIFKIDDQFRIDRNAAAIQLIENIRRFDYTWQDVERQLAFARNEHYQESNQLRSWTDARITKWAHGLVDLPANEEIYNKLKLYEISLETAIHRAARPHRIEHKRLPDQLKEHKYYEVGVALGIRWREHRNPDITKAEVLAEITELISDLFERAYSERHRERTLDVVNL